MSIDVNIERFELRGDSSNRSRLLDGLDQQNWPGQDTEKTIVIRHLQVTGQWWQLGEAAAAEARALVANAVHADSSMALLADSVYFHSHAELIACLCRDINANDSDKWYWHHYQHSDSPSTLSIVDLLVDSVLELPAIVSILTEMGALQMVFTSLDRDDVKRIIRTIAVATGWHHLLESNTTTESAVSSAELDYLPPAIVPRVENWSSVINKTAPSCKSIMGGFATLITCWQMSPNIINNPSVYAQLCAYVNYRFQGAIQEKSDSEKPASIDSKVDEVESFARVEGNQPNFTEENSSVMHVSAEVERAQLSSKKVADISTKNAVSSVVDETDEGFVTQFGGLFFVLNICVQSQLSDELMQRGVSPWHFLYRFAQWMGVEPDQPLLDFLLRQLDLESLPELYDMGSVPGETALFELIEQRYQHQKFWGAPLLDMPAIVNATQSHINVYFHINSVQLDIRLAGLDVNPGWIRWVGRVVTFHFDQYARLQGYLLP